MSDWDEELERPVPVVVPHQELSADALRGVIESFVLREGTDYGESDVPHDAKVAQVLRQLENGEVQIVFDPADSSVTILVAAGRGSPTAGARRS
ncbi:MAG TPA: YheU family protein [Steroidobacteraceae bacterium]